VPDANFCGAVWRPLLGCFVSPGEAWLRRRRAEVPEVVEEIPGRGSISCPWGSIPVRPPAGVGFSDALDLIIDFARANPRPETERPGRLVLRPRTAVEPHDMGPVRVPSPWHWRPMGASERIHSRRALSPRCRAGRAKTRAGARGPPVGD